MDLEPSMQSSQHQNFVAVASPLGKDSNTRFFLSSPSKAMDVLKWNLTFWMGSRTGCTDYRV
ncbi:hypothetical protein CFP56_031963 [Quercus suber]|uniref:Uncharacterized protein n=1 Tax=Quercus suber TaxID=58331 RepID=A0AAW0JJ92_QUESU